MLLQPPRLRWRCSTIAGLVSVAPGSRNVDTGYRLGGYPTLFNAFLIPSPIGAGLLAKDALPQTAPRRFIQPVGNAFNHVGQLLHLHLQVAGAGRKLRLRELALAVGAHVLVHKLADGLSSALGGFLHDGPRFHIHPPNGPKARVRGFAGPASFGFGFSCVLFWPFFSRFSRH